MIDQNAFMETLREVKEIVRTAPSPLTQEEMLAYFKDMELTDEQKNMVCAYLVAPPEEDRTEEEQDNEAEADTETDTEETENSLPDSKVFQMYMDELNSLTPIKEDELSMMYIRLLRGDDKVIQSITNGWMKKVIEISRKYSSSKYLLEDVIQEGNMGLFIKLTELCGCNQPIDVEEALTEAVEGSMKAYISEITGEDDSEQTVIGKVNLVSEAMKYLSSQNGEEPSFEELVRYTGIEAEELSDIMEFMKKAEN